MPLANLQACCHVVSLYEDLQGNWRQLAVALFCCPEINCFHSSTNFSQLLVEQHMLYNVYGKQLMEIISGDNFSGLMITHLAMMKRASLSSCQSTIMTSRELSVRRFCAVNAYFLSITEYN